MVISIFLLIIGFALLILGANWLVAGSVALARKFRIPELTVGLTIVAFGTSMPELVVSLIGAIQGHADVALGNAIGSNNFNIFIVLGLAGLLQPLKVQHSTVWKEIPFSIIGAVLLLLFGNNFFLEDGSPLYISRLEGIALLLLFVVFVLYISHSLRKEIQEPAEINHTEGRSANPFLIKIVLGLASLLIGGQLVVDKALALAAYLQLSEGLVGLTIIAIGTSLPELATSLIAALKNKADLAVGNIIGSNIFNILLVLGISATTSPLPFASIYNRELYILLAGSAILFMAMFTGSKHKLDRWEALFLMAAYLFYLYYAYGGNNLLPVISYI